MPYSSVSASADGTQRQFAAAHADSPESRGLLTLLACSSHAVITHSDTWARRPLRSAAHESVRLALRTDILLGTSSTWTRLTSRVIRIAGHHLKDGKLVPDMRRLSFSQRLRQLGSKRVRVARNGDYRVVAALSPTTRNGAQ